MPVDVLAAFAKITAGEAVSKAESDAVIDYIPRIGKGLYNGGVDPVALRASIIAAGEAAPLELASRQGCASSLNPIIKSGPLNHGGTPPAAYALCGTSGLYNPHRPRIVLPPEGIPIPSSIDDTGATDVTIPLLDFVGSADVSDGTVAQPTVIQFPPNKTYRIENALLFRMRNNIAFEGNGCQLIANTTGAGVTPHPSLSSVSPPWPLKRVHVMFQDCTGIVFRDFTIRGAHPSPGAHVAAYEGQHGVCILGGDNIELDNVSITAVYGDFILLGNNFNKPNWASNIWIHGGVYDGCGRQGIAVTGAQDVLLDNLDVTNVARTFFDIEADTGAGGCKRLTLQNSIIRVVALNFVSNVGSGGSVIEDITIQDNTVLRRMNITMGSHTMPPGFRKRVKILRNTSTVPYNGAFSPLMNFFSFDGVEVVGNSEPIPAGVRVGARATNCSNVDIHDNAFAGALYEHQISVRATASYEAIL